MIKFIIKGILRDRSRSVFPILTVTMGVIITVFMYTYINGFTENFISTNARFQTGHVKITTHAYHELIDQQPNDLALLGVNDLLKEVNEVYPEIRWAERIYFGGLIDVPDEKGETQAQTFFQGMAIDMLTSASIEHELLNPKDSIVRGRMAKARHEILISDQLAKSLDINMGDEVTLISETMEGSMAFGNFVVVGTVRFGLTALDRTAILAEINDIRPMLSMEEAAGELLGFLPSFQAEKVDEIAKDFNHRFSNPDDEFSPVMLSLLDQENLRSMFEYVSYANNLIVGVFVIMMCIVLWNAGLMNGIRRYGEIGVRLAIGEGKFHLYRVMVYESLLIGILGTILGTTFGLLLSYYVQNVGIDISQAMPDASLMMADVLRTNVTKEAYFVGFIPGLFATTMGAALAGIGIIKRNTAQLFKELEV